MHLRLVVKGSATALLGACFLFAAGCVEPFGGSNIQFLMSGSSHIPGTPADFGRPPPGTHYEFHGVQTTTDANGNPVQYTFKAAEFDIRPVIDRASPCFIEDDESRFPGLHVTMFLDRLADEFGIADPSLFDPQNPPSNMSDNDVIDFLTAQVRMNNLGLLETGIKAITTHSPVEYPTDIPAADRIDDASNATRRARCEAFWDANPLRYEGSDKVFTLPLNGKWFGAVDGQDPRANVFLGGAAFFVEPDLQAIDGMLLNWQYNCDEADFQADETAKLAASSRDIGKVDIISHDCEPVVPMGADSSPVGFHYMSGTVVDKVRGVINVPLQNRTFGQLSGEAVIFTDLDSDEVNF